VVTASPEIDVGTVADLRAILVEWQGRGNATVVVDMTGTQSCDQAGLRELVLAHKRAVHRDGALLLVVPAESALLASFATAGLDGVIPRFATLEQALAQIPDSRSCEQCEAVFVAQREHARFCTSDCQAAWDREHLGDPAVATSALTWSIAAMSEATARLPAVKVSDQVRAFAAIEEAVWWITMVDATLVRHRPAPYDAVLADHTPPERQVIEQILAGLLFVRNCISRGTGLGQAVDTFTGTSRVTGWAWKPVRRPAPAELPPRAQAWELARHRAYLAVLAGRTIGETIGKAVTFLSLAGSQPQPPRR
jgi:anti-anti-sigma factor